MAYPVERWTPAGPIRSRLSSEAIEQEEARAAASVGDATPLGLFALASTAFVLGTIHAGWFIASAVLVALPLVFVAGGLAQFIAGMWSYRKGDTFAATTFGALGAFYTTYASVVLVQHSGLLGGAAVGTDVLGLVLICFALIAGALMVAAARVRLALVGVLLFLALAYGLTGIADLVVGATSLLHYGGWAGVIAAVLAFYTGAALVINSLNGREVLPLGVLQGPSMSPAPAHASDPATLTPPDSAAA
jgi:succinate-acetate transporter protein